MKSHPGRSSRIWFYSQPWSEDSEESEKQFSVLILARTLVILHFKWDGRWHDQGRDAITCCMWSLIPWVLHTECKPGRAALKTLWLILGRIASTCWRCSVLLLRYCCSRSSRTTGRASHHQKQNEWPYHCVPRSRGGGCETVLFFKQCSLCLKERLGLLALMKRNA